MPSPFKTKEFKTLQKEFYDKLADSGFEDIEETDSPKELLTAWHGSYFTARHDPEDFKEIAQYYNSADSILNNYEFSNEVDKQIWERHSKGLSIRRIALELSIKNWVVHKSIQKFKSIFITKKNNVSVNLVEIRNGVIADSDLIYATWLRPLYYDNDLFSEIGRDQYFKTYPKIIEKILERPAIWVRIACLKEDPDVILGYAVLEKDMLHWIYVKKAWRELGLAKKLVPPYIVQFSHATNLGLKLKPKDWIFNPFI